MEARKILFQKPQLFLERFGQLLTDEELGLMDEFSQNSDEDLVFEVKSWVKKIRVKREQIPYKVRMRRRKEFLKQMKNKKDPFFTESEMASRNPGLFHELLGKYHYVTRFEEEKVNKQPVTTLLLEHLDRVTAWKGECPLSKPGDEELNTSSTEASGEDEKEPAESESRSTRNASYTHSIERKQSASRIIDHDIDQATKTLSAETKKQIEQGWNKYVAECEEETAARGKSLIDDPTHFNVRNRLDFANTFGMLQLDKEKLESARESFQLEMEKLFLLGQDDFDYRDVDGESKYDDEKLERQDGEDAYFDE